MADAARAGRFPSSVAGDASFNSLAALFKFLDPPNRQLLRLMRRLGPAQISSLVTKSRRPLSEIKMVLAVFRAIGLVKMDLAAGRRLWTALPVGIHITIDPYKRDRWIKIRVCERAGR
ncbi:putative MarR family transcriptional regulator [Hyphomicrobium sp. 1Nfss2.1]